MSSDQIMGVSQRSSYRRACTERARGDCVTPAREIQLEIWAQIEIGWAKRAWGLYETIDSVECYCDVHLGKCLGNPGAGRDYPAC